MSVHGLCSRRRAALAIYTLLRAYILTMWFSPSQAVRCLRSHELTGCCRAFSYCLTRAARGSWMSAPRPLRLGGWVTRRMEVCQRTSFLRWQRESNPPSSRLFRRLQHALIPFCRLFLITGFRHRTFFIASGSAATPRADRTARRAGCPES